jgi:transcription antitermination factor NusG
MFRPDARVRIVTGIFAGYDGRIMTPDEATKHHMVAPHPGDADPMQHVMLSLFGRDVPLHIPSHEIEYA